MLSVNRIFPLRVLTAGAISLFLNIMDAIAPVAPVLNTPLLLHFSKKFSIFQLKKLPMGKNHISATNLVKLPYSAQKISVL